jgi:hypothetical protein
MKDARSRKLSAGVPHLYLAGSEQIYKLLFTISSRFLGMRTNLSKWDARCRCRAGHGYFPTLIVFCEF